MSTIDKPDAEWVERDYCPECDDLLPFNVVVVDGETFSTCAFCGLENQTYAYEGMFDLDDGGWS